MNDHVVFIDQEENEIILEGRDDFEANFTGIEAGEYEFTASVTDTTAEDTATIEVTEAADEDYSFTSVEQVESGDVAEITVSVEESNEAVVVLGGEDVGYASAVNLTDLNDLDGNELTLTYNTHDAGNSPWGVADEDNSNHVANQKTYRSDLGTDPLPSYNWDLSIGAELVDNFNSTNASTYELKQELDRDALAVQPHGGFGDVTTGTAPAGADVSSLEDLGEVATATDTIAEDDLFFVTLENYGAEGSIDNINNHYFDLEITQNNGGPIGNGDVFNTSGDADYNLTLTPLHDSADDYEGDLVFLVEFEAEAKENFDVTADHEVTFTVDNANPYVDEDDDKDFESDVNVEFEERELAWDDIESLPAEDGASASGYTNVAPGTELDTDVDSDEGGFIDLSDAVVQADGTFTSEFDLAGETAGVTFTLTAEDSASAVTNPAEKAVLEDLTLTKGEEAESDVSIDADAPSNVAVDEEASLDVIITNDGDEAAEYAVVVDGETVADGEIEAGDEISDSLEFDTSEEGDIDWEVTDGDKSASGTLTVEEESNSDEDGNSDDDGDDDSDDDATPGFGVAVALVALLAAAMLALRRQN